MVPGATGVLVDANTRIPGLVAAKTPRSELRIRREANARSAVAHLEAELRAARAARAHANIALALLLGALGFAALFLRSAHLARAALLAAPAMVALGLGWRSTTVLWAGALVLALVLAAPARLFRPLCVLVLVGALVVLWHWPVTNSLATIGPHPDGGRRFYGVTNQVETLLLPTALAAGPFAAPLALVAIGWSRAGADGGGLLVFAAGYATLLLRASGRVTPRRLLVAAAAVVAVGLLVVGVDAATGGSSHVTHAVGSGLPGDLAHRIRVSAEGATRSGAFFLMFAAGAVTLILIALVRPRPVLLDALLVALAVSLVVNDTPQDVAAWGAFGALAVLALERAGRLAPR